MDTIVWDKAEYCWPDHIDPAMQNWIVVKDRGRGLEVARGQKKLRRVLEFHESYARLPCLYSGPLMPPSLRMRQKWMAISTVTITGMNTQCST